MLTHTEAVGYLRALRRTLMRAQGHLREQADNWYGPEEAREREAFVAVSEQLWPWVYGPRSLLPTVIALKDRVDKGQPMEPINFFNLMIIVGRLDILLDPLCEMVCGVRLPQPDSSWLSGWGPE